MNTIRMNTAQLSIGMTRTISELHRRMIRKGAQADFNAGKVKSVRRWSYWSRVEGKWCDKADRIVPAWNRRKKRN